MHDAKATAWQKCRCVTRRCTATVSRPQLIICNSITNNFVQRRYWIEIWQHKTQYQSCTLFPLTSENVSCPLTIALPGQRLRPARPEGQPAGRAAGSTPSSRLPHTRAIPLPGGHCHQVSGCECSACSWAWPPTTVSQWAASRPPAEQGPQACVVANLAEMLQIDALLINPALQPSSRFQQCHQVRFQSLAGFQDSTVAGFRDCEVADFGSSKVPVQTSK